MRARVDGDLKALGTWKREETALVAVLISLLIVILKIRSWRDLAGCWHAWDALIWLGGFVSIAESLKTTRFTEWFSGRIEAQLAGFGPLESTAILALVYFASMYLFSQLTAHIAALAGAFFAVAANVGSPPYIAVALIAYFSCLCGAMTPWSTGPVIIYFHHGYVPVGRWMRNGACLAAMHLTVWFTVGMAWWKWLGWW